MCSYSLVLVNLACTLSTEKYWYNITSLYTNKHSATLKGHNTHLACKILPIQD